MKRRRRKKRGRGMQTRQVIVKGKDTGHMMAISLSPCTVPNSEISLLRIFIIWNFRNSEHAGFIFVSIRFQFFKIQEMCKCLFHPLKHGGY